MSIPLPPIIDADGHVFEDNAAIWELMAEPYKRERQVVGQSAFPQLDHMHLPVGKTPAGSFDLRVKFPEWKEFAKDLGLQAAVLYPTFALGYGRIPNPNWAIAATTAYNDWLTQAYCSNGSPLKGMALIPMQNPKAAAKELRRAVTELGMPGAMLPPTGLRHYLGDEEYWPIYEVANELGCAMAVHGGAHQGLGLDQMRTFPPVHALGHPYGVMANFASLVFNGVFERFPNVKFAFLEAGVSWLLLCLERFGGSAKSFQNWDPSRENQQLIGDGMTDNLIEQLNNGQLFVGVEGDEFGLASAVKLVGAGPFVFSSDYPHEVNTEICRHEIGELLENPDITQADKEAILYHNAAKLYNIKVPARA
jgi:predicted TIM-barrel fold metal-dependent hydrolase